MPELKEKLEELALKLEGKSKEEVKTAIEAFETKNKEAMELAVKTVKDELELTIKELKEDAEKRQEHLDKLDVKLQAKVVQGEGPKDPIRELIVDNFDKIKMVRKGQAVCLETKTVANMTLSTALTGDAPRSYRQEVTMVPGQLLNVADLCQNIPIAGGTLTYPLESGAGEGSISTQTEGSDKSQRDYDFVMTDIATDFIAGFLVYSKKMANNLPFLENFIPQALRRDYWIAENTAFDAVLNTAATASSQVITSKNKIEMLMNELAVLAGLNEQATAIVMTPADYNTILQTEKSTGAGYGLPVGVTYDNGQLRILGIPTFQANWVDTNKYFVGDWNEVKKVTTMGLKVEFSEHDEDNFRKNNISARVEAQVGIALLRTTALIYGDFTAT